MEILVIIVAFWLLVAGAYGAVTSLRSGRSRVVSALLRPPRDAFIAGGSLRVAPPAAAFLPDGHAPPARQLAAGPAAGISTAADEVDVLRARVEYLRGELAMLASVARVGDKPRRPASGSSAYLSRPLRRNVREVRSLRRVRPS